MDHRTTRCFLSDLNASGYPRQLPDERNRSIGLLIGSNFATCVVCSAFVPQQALLLGRRVFERDRQDHLLAAPSPTALVAARYVRAMQAAAWL